MFTTTTTTTRSEDCGLRDVERGIGDELSGCRKSSFLFRRIIMDQKAEWTHHQSSTINHPPSTLPHRSHTLLLLFLSHTTHHTPHYTPTNQPGLLPHTLHRRRNRFRSRFIPSRTAKRPIPKKAHSNVFRLSRIERRCGPAV